jgi:anti-repressor protein
MRELIKITTNDQGDQLINGRDLHKFLDIKEKYTQWFDRMIDYGFEENIDYITMSEKREIGIGKGLTDNILKLSMAKEISMIQRTDRGKQARLYFIECERKLKEIKPSLPKNYIEALHKLIKAEEEKEMLRMEIDLAYETKAWISDKKTATAMNMASQLSKENKKLKEKIGAKKTYRFKKVIVK